MLLGLCVMLGTRCFQRSCPAEHDADHRRGARLMGWAGLIAGLHGAQPAGLRGVPARAIVQQVTGTPLAELPAWARYAADLGLMRLDSDALDPTFGDASAFLSRDLSTRCSAGLGGLAAGVCRGGRGGPAGGNAGRVRGADRPRSAIS